MICIKGVTKRFGRFVALDNVSLDIERGQAVALWGSNGAGKTTLLRCTLGLLSFRGEVTVNGVDVRRRGKPARRLLGYVPQELAFYDDFRVAEAVAFFARLKGTDRTGCVRALQLAGLEQHRHKRVRELSGGMKQRLALGIATLTDPPILMLDEPTSNLDAAGRSELLAQLAELRGRGKTVFFTSHRPEEVEELANRVITMESGRIVSDAAPARNAGAAASPSVEVRIPHACLDQALGALRAEGFTTRLAADGAAVECRNGCNGHVSPSATEPRTEGRLP
ncbi:MAG: ABC transporter ATP-binding protein [Phycisphaerales bacterium]|nr:ABC transporter ATP-binding protein [Phycisphaerales bacterium]